MATLLTWMLRLFMALMGLVFLLGLLAALGLYVLWAVVRWLLTGRKPQVVMVWQQFSAMSKSFGRRRGFHHPNGENGQRAWSRPPHASQNDQIVDVQVREVHDAAPSLPNDKA